MSNDTPDLPPLKPTVNSKDEFDKLMSNSKGPVVVDFLMNGCEPCLDSSEKLGALSTDCSGHPVTIASVDVEAPWVAEMADKLNVAGTPTALYAPTFGAFLAGDVEEVDPGSKALRSKLKCALPGKK